MNYQIIDLKYILEDNEILTNISNFLEPKELLNLTLVTIQALPKLKQLQKNYQINDFVKWKKLALTQPIYKSKQKNKEHNKVQKLIKTDEHFILKIKFPLVPNQLFSSSVWKFINNIEKLSQKIKNDDFIVENNNFFFENEKEDILFMNRSLIDPSLDILEQKQFEQSKEQKYQDLHQGDEFSNIKYDFTSMESMKLRQKHITEQLNKVKKLTKIEDLLPIIPTYKRITIILCFGGKFSFGIFEGVTCVLHKSDSKYVVRKKAGGRQITKDQSKGIQSIGSQIRRDQENKHQTNVTNLIKDNFQELEKSDIIFFQAPGMNKFILINEDDQLQKLEYKMRSLCLTSKKANYTEVEKVYKAITKVYFVFDNQTHKVEKQYMGKGKK